jgi:hypothetical protein
VNLLRQSFAGINSRFHLVGFYTLLYLAVRLVAVQVDDSAEWGLLFVFVVTGALVCTFGILGLVYMAAAGRPAGRPRFIECAAVLFLPLVWLQVKIALLVYVPMGVGLYAWHQIAAPGQAIEAWAPGVIWRIEPAVDAAILLLTVYSTPAAIRLRERRAWGRPIREGLALFRARTGPALSLLALVLLTAGVGAAVHFAEQPEQQATAPGLTQGLALLLTSWLTLAALYGASLLLLERPPGGASPPPNEAAAAPGPEA